MSVEKKTIANLTLAAEFIAIRILEQLEQGKKVLWLIPGGSAQKVALLSIETISRHPHKNLTISLTDERLGKVGHQDSNWREWKIPEAKLIPVLGTENWLKVLEREIENNEYKIGLFGIGANGHTAGLLPPESVSKWQRVSITPELIKKLDEAVLYAEGEDKQFILDSFQKGMSMPAQVLKEVSKLKIFYVK